MADLNYAEQYSQELAQAYPYVLYSGALWNTENSKKYKVIDAKTIKIPSIKVGGRVDGDRDTIGSFTRNFSNDWETKTLTGHRQWQTLVHPRDIDETNAVASISNITKVMNEEEKFPEMDAKIFSTIYQLRNDQKAITPLTEDLTVSNVLDKFDEMMDAMDEARVPQVGRILYCDTFTKTAIDKSIAIVRGNGQNTIVRDVTRLEQVNIVPVPTSLLKTKYKFDTGFTPDSNALDIKMMLVHPSSILPIVSYAFAQLQSPSAMSQGKYVYFEESFEDVFILNKRVDAIQIAVKSSGVSHSQQSIAQFDATLSALTVGALELSPAFESEITSYTATSANATNTISAAATDSNSTIVIKHGDTVIANGSAATWDTGENTVTITVTNGSSSKTYTVVVTKAQI